MEHVSSVLKKRNGLSNNVINEINDIIANNESNDNNVAFKKEKYALNREKFTPNTEESQLAEDIAVTFDDADNFACYMDVINKIGVLRARQLWEGVISDIKEKKDTKYFVRNPGAYFMWKYKHSNY